MHGKGVVIMQRESNVGSSMRGPHTGRQKPKTGALTVPWRGHKRGTIDTTIEARRTVAKPAEYSEANSMRKSENQYQIFLQNYGIDNLKNYTALESDLFTNFIDESQIECTLCGVVEKSSRHKSDDAHIARIQHVDRFIQLRSQVLQDIPKDSSLQGAVSSHILKSWIMLNSLSVASKESRISAIEDFGNVLAEVSPECEFRILGSFLTGSSLIQSNVNLEVLHPNTRLFVSDPRARDSIHHKLIDPDAEYGFQINYHTLHYDLIDNAVSTLNKLKQLIHMKCTSNTSFSVIRNAENLNSKTPELLLFHHPTSTELSVCCYGEDSNYKLACLFRNYLSLDERAVMLSILVKHWTKTCGICDPKLGTLSPDTFQVMVIYFLQRTQPPVLPCLHELLTKKSAEHNLETKDRLVGNLKKLTIDQEDNTNIHSNQKIDDPTNKASTEDPNSNMYGEGNDADEFDDDKICNEFDVSFIDSLSWVSANTSSIRRLFLEFMRFYMNDFRDRTRVISIRTLDTISLSSKNWTTEIKAVENPVKPRVNLSRSIGTRRTFNYIQQCFAYGYFYLSSLPTITKEAQESREPRTDPSNNIRIFVNLKKLDFYCKMKSEAIRRKIKFNPIIEMMRQDVFAKDIDIITDFVEKFSRTKSDPQMLVTFMAERCDPYLLLPLDSGANIYCWLCRKNGHPKIRCPEIRSAKKCIPQGMKFDDRIDEKVNFDQQFLELYTNDRITDEISKSHHDVVKRLTDAIRKGTGLRCNLTLFGSTVNLLGSSDSDLDICMTLAGNQTGKDIDCASILKETCVILARDFDDVQNMEPILTARVPIIKFNCAGYAIDLCMYNQCAIHNSRLLRSYAMIEHRLPQLFYLVKRYAKACGIADASKGSLSSYAWSILVIHFMQRTQPPLLPVLQEPPKGKSKPMFGVNGWNVWFEDNIKKFKKEPTNVSITTLFKNFLCYYAKFNYDKQVISIRTSGRMCKFQKNWHSSIISIEDPFELTYNLSGRLDEPMALYIINSFSMAWKRITEIQKTTAERNASLTLDAVRGIFEGRKIMSKQPPVRGCRYCHKIGHRVKDCPTKQR